jgi:Uma2 family endonuclease
VNRLKLPRAKRVNKIFIAHGDQIAIPAWVEDFDSFRRWLHLAEFPEKGKICFINNAVWVDLSMEEFFAHNQVRAEITRVLANLMKETKYGRFAPEGMRYSHLETNLSTEPDGMIISNHAINTGRVQFVGGEKGHQTEVTGSPEIAIEIVSKSSEVKDTEWAMSAYFDAGIEEYWLIDAREEDDIQFNIFKRSKKEFSAVRKQNGWVKSSILGKAFRLIQSEDDAGNPDFTLEVR